MIDRRWIGHRLPPSELTIDRARLRFFAQAIGETDPVYTDVAGLFGNAGQSNHAAAKAGVVGLTQTLAKEWGRMNVTVNCAAFGLIKTRLTGNAADRHLSAIDRHRLPSTPPREPRHAAQTAPTRLDGRLHRGLPRPGPSLCRR